MRLLVINSGSSSIKFTLFETEGAGRHESPGVVLEGELAGIGGEATLKLTRENQPAEERGVAAPEIAAGCRLVLAAVSEERPPDAVGYRVVHPGAKLDRHQRITPDVLTELEAAAAFAPLHDPAVVDVIRAAQAQFPDIPHFACFDTVFHQTMPAEATTYPLPLSLRREGVKRYGFHGLSCESIVVQMRASESPFPVPARMAIAHLGSGCSVTGLLDGRSVDTSMGLTPTGGVVMGTRPGDLDPGLIFYLLRQHPGDETAATAAVEAMLNHHAGLVGLTGLANDMRAIRQAATQGNADGVLALQIFARSVTRALGGLAWLLGGLDTIVFTGGIGEHDAATRAEVLAGLESQGVGLNSEQNHAAAEGMHAIHAEDSKVNVLVIPAQEDLMIARHVLAITRERTG